MVTMYGLIVAVFVFMVGGFLFLRCTKPDANSLIAKTTASFIFVLIAALGLLDGNMSATKIMFVLGLVCGLVGDILLDLKVNDPKNQNSYLTNGMLFFGIGHIFYFVAIYFYSKTFDCTGWGWANLAAIVFALVLSAIILANQKSLKLDFAGYKTQSYLYSTALIFMACTSVCLSLANPFVWVLAVGFVLFLASDLVLSKQYFGGKQDSKVLTVVNHVLYYAAQLLIASFVFFV